jgi:2-methylcitrate dehydratase PrpD
MDDDFSAVLANFASHACMSSIPTQVMQAAKRSIFDTLCGAVAGSAASAVGDVHGLAVEWGGRAQADLWVFGERVPAHHAAWVNGTMAHACNYGDTHDGAVLQASVSVVPAALAAAQLVNASGKEFLAAVVVGLETVCRLGVSTRMGISESGYMYTSLFGGFGATLAVAKVMGLSTAQIINALGIAYSQVSGNQQASRDAALAKRMQPGFAAMAAVLSGQLAQRGISGSQGTFDGADGFLRVYLHGQCDSDALREGLGERFEMLQLSCKPYPCSRFTHTAIDAVLDLRAQGLKAADVARIEIGLNRQAYEAVRGYSDPKKLPMTLVQAQFSVPLVVAAALVDGCVRLGHFSKQALLREDLQVLAKRVSTHVDEGIERASSRNVSPVSLVVSLHSGKKLTHQVFLPLGHPSKPMEMMDLEAKAVDCFAASSLPARDGAALALRSWVEQLEVLKDVNELVATLKPEPKPLLFAMSG